MSPLRVTVVGGGIAGLALAHRLVRRADALGRPLQLKVLEASPQFGGHARTLRESGFVVEAGPNGFLDRLKAPLELASELGLRDRLIEARPEAARRYVVRDRRLRRVPDTPRTLLTTDALSPAGKLRLLLEPWAKSPPPACEESVDEFARRRIGAEATEVLVDAAVSGITAGDPRELSLPAAFPLMARMEREHGSLIRAFVARRRSGQKSARLLSLRDGMGSLVDALARGLGDRLLSSRPVTRLARDGGQWRVTDTSGAEWLSDQVALALPARGAARLLASLDGRVGGALDGTPFSSVAVVALGLRADDLPGTLDGYGYLVPRAEGMTTLGVVRESSLFEGRAPAGHALLRIILGGPRDPLITRRTDEELVTLARSELARVVGEVGTPVASWVFRWPCAIAQYVRGHQARMVEVFERVARQDGLFLCGSSYDGVSFGSAIDSGRALADRMLARVPA